MLIKKNNITYYIRINIIKKKFFQTTRDSEKTIKATGNVENMTIKKILKQVKEKLLNLKQNLVEKNYFYFLNVIYIIINQKYLKKLSS